MSAAKIDPTRVLKVYSGKPGCCCGCRGIYRYTRASRELGSKERGYPVNDKEVNDGLVTKTINFLNFDERTVYEDGHFFLDTGTHWYIVYLVQPEHFAPVKC